MLTVGMATRAASRSSNSARRSTMRLRMLAASIIADLYHCFERPRAACRARVDASRTPWHNDRMSMLDAVKDVVVGRAMRVMSDPRISRVMGDERVMNVAMKAVGIGGSIKAELDRASRFAAGLFGLAT